MPKQLLNILFLLAYTTLPVLLNESLQTAPDLGFAFLAAAVLTAPYILFPSFSFIYTILLALGLYFPLWLDLCHRLIFDSPIDNALLSNLYHNPLYMLEFAQTYMTPPTIAFSLLILLWLCLAVSFIPRISASCSSTFIIRTFFWSSLVVSGLHLWAEPYTIEGHFIPLQFYQNVKQIAQNSPSYRQSTSPASGNLPNEDFDFKPILSFNAQKDLPFA